MYMVNSDHEINYNSVFVLASRLKLKESNSLAKLVLAGQKSSYIESALHWLWQTSKAYLFFISTLPAVSTYAHYTIPQDVFRVPHRNIDIPPERGHSLRSVVQISM